MPEREVREIIRAHPSRDGDGVAIDRVAGMRHPGFDPFLMLDELRARRQEDVGGGFPPHPHRGMQTLTYLLQGGIRHEDSRGNVGEIRQGGVQWMSAGRGIIHSEMPSLDKSGFHGFQLWINLSAAEKGAEPRYRDIPASRLPVAEQAGWRAVAIADTWQIGDTALRGALEELEPRAGILDLELAPGAEVAVAASAGQAMLAYVFQGSLEAGAQSVAERHMVVTGPGAHWVPRAGASGARLLLLRGWPLREPVAHYGPFVMNTREEIEQAIQDYQAGRLG